MGVSGPSLLIESTDSMMSKAIINSLHVKINHNNLNRHIFLITYSYHKLIVVHTRTMTNSIK